MRESRLRPPAGVQVHERLEEEPVELQLDRRSVGMEKQGIEGRWIGRDIEAQSAGRRGGMAAPAERS
jgi:hypothetical protein